MHGSVWKTDALAKVVQIADVTPNDCTKTICHMCHLVLYGALTSHDLLLVLLLQMTNKTTQAFSRHLAGGMSRQTALQVQRRVRKRPRSDDNLQKPLPSHTQNHRSAGKSEDLCLQCESQGPGHGVPQAFSSMGRSVRYDVMSGPRVFVGRRIPSLRVVPSTSPAISIHAI